MNREARRTAAIRSLADFTRQAWAIIEPATPLVNGWHIDCVAEHLEAVALGQIRRLVIEIPPGHMKSTIASVMFPAWMWARGGAAWRGLFASYDGRLAIRDSIKTRTVVQSPWYRENFSGPAGWRLVGDQNTKEIFQTTRTGWRQALTVLSGGTGHRGDVVMVDDSMSVDDSFSRAHRERVIAWWDLTMSSRLSDLATGAFVVIGQRLHRQDLTGHCLGAAARGEVPYDELCLPSEYDPKRSRVVVGRDIRSTDGELLFAAKFPADVLAEQKLKLRASGYSAQHQQDPVAEGGALFLRPWWRFWRADGAPASSRPRPDGCAADPARVLPGEFEAMAISVDAAFKDTVSGSNVALQVWGAIGADRYLLDRVCRPMTFTATVEALRSLCARWPDASRKFIEDKANGTAIIDHLKTEIAGLIPVTPEGGKEARANAVTAQVESGNVYLPEDAPWLEEYLIAMTDFPFGDEDDDVDATTQALTQMAGSGDVARLLALAEM